MIHFLVVEDYESTQSISHILSVPLTLECDRILFWSISFFFYLNGLPDYDVCKILIWADDTALNLSCDKLFDLLQQVQSLLVVIWSYKYENAIPDISENAIPHPIIYWYLENYPVFTS